MRSRRWFPSLAAAGIPIIAPVPVDPSVTTSSVSFPITSGVPGDFIAMPQLLADRGATKISLIYPDIPGAATAKLFVSAGIKKAGVQDGGSVPVATDATDLTPAIVAATQNGTNGVVAFLLGNTQGTLLQQAKQQNITAKLATASAFLTPSLLQSLGSTTNGLLRRGHDGAHHEQDQGRQMFVEGHERVRQEPGPDGPRGTELARYVGLRAGREDAPRHHRGVRARRHGQDHATWTWAGSRRR